jgi:type II secretory pathway pseudopilin PulG
VRHRRQQGFTAADLVMTLALFAILGAATFPPMFEAMQTYRRKLAVRKVLSDIRVTQSLAVTRGGVFGLQWGAGPSVNKPPSWFRLVRDTTGACGLPPTGAPLDGTDVIRDWADLADEYPGLRIQAIRDRRGKSLGAVFFDSVGTSVNPCTSVSFPVRVIVSDGHGGAETLEVRRSGVARVL